MIAKAWNYFVNKFSKQEEPKKGVLLPFSRHPLPAIARLTFSLMERPQQGQVDVSGVEQFSQEAGGSKHAELAQQLINEIRTLEDQLRRMHINTRKVNQSQKECHVFDASKLQQMRKQHQIDRQPNFDLEYENQINTRKVNQSQKECHVFDASKLQQMKKQHQIDRQPNFDLEYEYQIIKFLELKYAKQKENFPLIPKEEFCQVMTYWRDKKHPPTQAIREYQNVKSVKKLTYKSMWAIDQGQWLNDDVINMSVEIMEKQLVQDSIKLLNSYFATTTVIKGDAVILRIMKKLGVQPNKVIIFPVNLNNNHWIFAKLDPNTQSLTIYDSLRKSNYHYLQNSIFQNALKFAKLFYGKDFQLVVSDSFPQQKNGFDCGMFVLNGIRDSLRGQEWTFDQFDIRYRRYQLACELLKQELMVASS